MRSWRGVRRVGAGSSDCNGLALSRDCPIESALLCLVAFVVGPEVVQQVAIEQIEKASVHNHALLGKHYQIQVVCLLTRVA
jgi:hypothetical protein